jgi:hypothetical protein
MVAAKDRFALYLLMVMAIVMGNLHARLLSRRISYSSWAQENGGRRWLSRLPERTCRLDPDL